MRHSRENGSSQRYHHIERRRRTTSSRKELQPNHIHQQTEHGVLLSQLSHLSLQLLELERGLVEGHVHFRVHVVDSGLLAGQGRRRRLLDEARVVSVGEGGVELQDKETGVSVVVSAVQRDVVRSLVNNIRGDDDN